MNLVDWSLWPSRRGGSKGSGRPAQLSPAAESNNTMSNLPNITSVLCPHCHHRTFTSPGTEARVSTCEQCGQAIGKPGAAAIAAQDGAAIVVGLVAAALGGLVGAGLWILIAYLTDYEIGYAAWALGGLVGAGMVWGTRTASPLHGVIAVLLTLVFVYVAKLGLLNLVVMPNVPFTADIDTEPREAIAQALAAEDAANDPTLQSDDDVGVAYQENLKSMRERVAGWSDEEVEAYVAEVREAYLVAQRESEGMVSVRDLLGPMDLLFIGLAVVTAYKLGTTGFGGGGG